MPLVRFLVAAFICAVTAGAAVATIISAPGNAGAAPDASHGTSTPTRTRTPSATPTSTPVPIPADAHAERLGLMIAECGAAARDGVRAIFLWHPAHNGWQWLDLSVYNDGFAPGGFVAAGPLHAGMYGYVWEGLLQGTTHFARINTLTPAGWQSSETFAFYTPVCDSGAFQAEHDPSPSDDMLALRANIESAIAASGIDTAVAITDLRTGETIDVNGDLPRLPGCTINLFALMRVVVDLQAGRYPEREAGDLISETIYRSDPVTSRLLVKYWIGYGDLGTGLVRVADFIGALGMQGTLLDHPPAFPQESLYGSVNNSITSRDANRGLRALWDGRVLLPGWRDYLMTKMTNVKPGLNYLIPAGVGYDATVSHKNGFLFSEGWADNDVGIVWFERRGQRYGYAISFFTERVPDKYADIPLGQRISSLAWQWFVGRYGYP